MKTVLLPAVIILVLFNLNACTSSVVENYKIDYDLHNEKLDAQALYKQEGPHLQDRENLILFSSVPNIGGSIQNSKLNSKQTSNLQSFNKTTQNNREQIYRSTYKNSGLSIYNDASNPGYFFPRTITPSGADKYIPRQVLNK